MKVGFCYDTKSDYGVDEENMEFTDFVSLKTISEIKGALENCGHEVVYIGNVYKLNSFLQSHEFDIDIFFNIAEGFGSRNRETWVPALLEINNLKHTGSDVYGMAVNLNKQHSKILVSSLLIPVADGICFREMTDDIFVKAEKLGFPIIVKPNSEGGSMGVSLIANQKELKDKIISIFEKGQFEELILEKYIQGREITVPVLGNGASTKALGVVATLHENGDDIALYDNELKYIDNVINTLEHRLGNEIESKLIEYSENIHRFFNFFDYSRMDFRVTPEGNIYFLEINTMPSLCRGGSFELCGRKMGLGYHEVIGQILNAALSRYSS